MENAQTLVFPCDPLEGLITDDEYRQRTIVGIIESYNSNYDTLSEAVQNSVDAIEDAALLEKSGPFRLSVTINLAENSLSVVDTGVGMTAAEIRHAFAPSVSHKNSDKNDDLLKRRKGKAGYRGYKGVGLTYLAYGTNSVKMHSKRDAEFTKRYCRKSCSRELKKGGVSC